MLVLSVWQDFSSVIRMAHLITEQVTLQVRNTAK